MENQGQTHAQAGQFLVELLITIALFSIVCTAIIGGLVSSSEGKPQQEQRFESVTLLSEAKQATLQLRERGWSGFAVNGTYHPILTGSTWSLVPGSEVIDGYTRSIVISDVFRDDAGNIVASGGSLDPSTKRVQIEVSWTTPIVSNISSTVYMTRYMDNISAIETSFADFSDGILQDVAVATNSGGEVVLGAGGNGDWCQPADNIIAQLDLPQNGAARDVKAIQGKAFTGTHVGASGSFVEIGITDESPPVPSILNAITGYQTNDVFIDQNYAYVATGDVAKDVVIIDLNTNQEVGYFNDDYWWGSAQGIFVKDNVGYVTIGPKLHTFDLSSKVGSRPELDDVCVTSFFCLATSYRLQVVGNYAYVAVDWGSHELRLINVANPSNISRAGYADVNGAAGQEVYVNETGTRAYLATSSSGSQREMFIINTTNKSGSMPTIGSYESNGMSPRGITVVPGNRAILVGTAGEEYQVIDTTNEASPSRCGGFNADTGIYGVASVLESDGDAYSYVVTADNTNEFKVILGGPGGGGARYFPEGTYESSILDTNITTAFNRFETVFTQPNQTSVTYQLAVANAVSGSCALANYTFLGPDKTINTFYTATGSAIPFGTIGTYSNPGRCFKYRFFLTTEDSAFTPVIEETTVNYSP